MKPVYRSAISVTMLVLSSAAAIVPASSQSVVKSSTPIAASASTSVPALVPYSGIAFADDGKPLTGEALFTFSLFKDERGGEPLWTESQMITADNSGHYQAQLGASSSTGLPMETFASGESRWLEIQIAGQKQQSRVLLMSVPYAMKAADASTLGGLPVSAFALAGTDTTTNQPRAADSALVSPSITGTITGVKAGTGLTGGGTSGTVTLNVNTKLIPQLAASNVFTNSNTFKPSLYEDTDINIDSTNSNPGNISPGLRLGSASGEGMASKRTSGGNQFGVDIYTGYQPRLSINSAGHVSIGTSTFNGSQLNVQGSTGGAGGDFTGGNGVSGGLASDGIDAQGGKGGEEGGAGLLGLGGLGDDDSGPGVVAIGGTGDSDALVVDAYPGVQAGYFDGNVSITGAIYADGIFLQSDHPTDPANKYLNHAPIESSEMMNIYTGNITTDELGLATIHLPDWFEAENADFRYQLTVMGQFAQAIIKSKIARNQFTIMTNTSHVEVSWQVAGIRQDAYAKAHPLVVEETKNAQERGSYKHPDFYGQPKEKRTGWVLHPQLMKRIQAMRDAQNASVTSNPRTLPTNTSH